MEVQADRKAQGAAISSSRRGPRRTSNDISPVQAELVCDILELYSVDPNFVFSPDPSELAKVISVIATLVSNLSPAVRSSAVRATGAVIDQITSKLVNGQVADAM